MQVGSGIRRGDGGSVLAVGSEVVVVVWLYMATR